MARVLVTDDDDGVRSFVADALALAGHDVEAACDGETARALLGAQSFDVLLTDLKMPGMGGMALVHATRADQPDVEIVVMTAHGSVDSAVEAMKAGAFDYLQKPLGGLAELRLVVERAMERRQLRTAALRAELDAPLEQALTWGAPAMAPVVDALTRVARTSATVLLSGESGTGKEVAARAIHRASPRAGEPFVALNCATLADNLIESELFGHEKGAFTGAHAQRRGRIELAGGGTLFLDEVGELRPGLQAKLLRVVQEREYERLGGSRTLRADVRWIAATNRDLHEMMAAGTFREDLYHRLAVFPIRLPPLRERREDIPELARVLLASIAKELGRPGLTLTSECVELLGKQTWSGNVRELRNVLERAAILSDGTTIDAGALWFEATPVAEAGALPLIPLADLERRAIESALSATAGNKTQAASLLGIGTRTLYDKLKRYEGDDR